MTGETTEASGKRARGETLPWLQAFGLAVLAFTVYLDAGNDSWNPDRELFALIGLAIVGVGPKELVQMLAVIWKKGANDGAGT